jgi:hypothetical protein
MEFPQRSNRKALNFKINKRNEESVQSFIATSSEYFRALSSNHTPVNQNKSSQKYKPHLRNRVYSEEPQETAQLVERTGLFKVPQED